MDFEFDKEIDALLRQSAQGEAVFAASPKSIHLDADEISAFAEKALPEKVRNKYTLHLADCDKCRKNLSSVILLNADDSSEIVHAEEKHFITVPIPWYRKLFAFPSLAYAMGALVLLFSGIAVYTVLQSNSNNAELSLETYQKQPSGKGMSSDGDQTASESYSSNSAAVSNTMMSNMAAANSSNSQTNVPTVPSAPISAANSNITVLRESADRDSPAGPKPIAPANEPTELARTDDSIVAGAAPPSPPPPAKENDFSADGEALKQNQTQNSIVQNQTEITPDSRNVKRAPMPSSRAEDKSRKAEDSKDDAAKLKSAAGATNIVGGKSFKRENNVWYDSAYRGQATVNVTRGTNEYKKLDSDLRGIAENLGGTVVVVWKQKAYRIQ